MRPAKIAERLKYWIEHPKTGIWSGPYKEIETVKREAKKLAKQTGKSVQVYSEKASTGLTKALEKMKAK